MLVVRWEKVCVVTVVENWGIIRVLGYGCTYFEPVYSYNFIYLCSALCCELQLVASLNNVDLHTL